MAIYLHYYKILPLKGIYGPDYNSSFTYDEKKPYFEPLFVTTEERELEPPKPWLSAVVNNINVVTSQATEKRQTVSCLFDVNDYEYVWPIYRVDYDLVPLILCESQQRAELTMKMPQYPLKDVVKELKRLPVSKGLSGDEIKDISSVPISVGKKRIIKDRFSVLDFS